MKKTVVAAVAVLVLASSAAHAGGFRYGSAGGNLGNWSYSDAYAGGSANAYGFGIGETYSASNSERFANESWNGNTSGARSLNESGFRTRGFGSAHSSSSALAGGGTGAGIGFKIGGVR